MKTQLNTVKKSTSTLIAVSSVLWIAISSSAFADGGIYGGYSSITDGGFGATVGTNIYNMINPDTPLPVARGDGEDVVKGTLQGIVAGESISSAFLEASENASGVHTLPTVTYPDSPMDPQAHPSSTDVFVNDLTDWQQ